MKDNSNKNQCIGRIVLSGLTNTRDLGGYYTMDGRKILPKRLLRSGALFEAPEEDLKILTDQCRLGTVIDFRTGEERRQKPDPEIPGVVNIFNPILDEKTVGITFEEEETQKKGDNAIRGILEHAASLGGNPRLYVDQLYEDLALNSHAARSYRRFFEILLEADERAVLWHCTAGKDRVGIGTALLLTALGVDRETIVKDFVMTNDFVEDHAEKIAGQVAAETGNKALGDCVRVLLTVSEEYILHGFQAMEQAYGNMDAYLEQHIGLEAEKREGLKRKFLTV